MAQITKHNAAMRKILLSSDVSVMQSSIDLDSIDLVLRDNLTITEMREAGSFFTGQLLATETVNSFHSPILLSSVVLDPTCGAGNLLIECSRKLDIQATLSGTLMSWGKVLWGFDIHAHFIEAAKLRLVIEALSRGVQQDCNLDHAVGFLENIRVHDAFKVNLSFLEKVTHVVMNPPFTIGASPRENYWKDGKVNTAGVVVDKYLRLLPDGCNISAILPEVLRSGSRYEGFRGFISSEVAGRCQVWGRFNRKTDVDVFILSGLKKKTKLLIDWYKKIEIGTNIADYFTVRTGPLVAYRDLEEGQSYPYFYPKNCPSWECLTDSTEERCFSGKSLTPPFVVIKRTSSPSDKFRASATIINLKQPVVIENHMIVVTPKDGELHTCKALLKVLRSNSTSDFLNDRIRLRHLTVGVIKTIPFVKA